MIYRWKIVPCLFIFLLVFSVVIVPAGQSCKDIIVPASATAGEYSLLLKVRDPSRDGLQVLCRVPKGTMYSYHHPWTGKPWNFTVSRTYLGVATKGDTLPDIVKAGMVLTDAGLAFGDADTVSGWVNPSKNAWDDFDWIRYACQTAENEVHATTLLTTEVVDRLHATGVSENLFLVGPEKAVVIEADALRYSIREVSDVIVMSNYAKDLWRTQLIRLLPVASSLDAQKESWVRRGTVMHLGSLCGVKIIQITSSSVIVQVVPEFVFKKTGLTTEITIPLEKRATVGPYSVRLLEINGTLARVSVCTVDYAWEQELFSCIEPSIGNITFLDMMHWSRLHSDDLDGLRPMCEDRVTYEASLICKIPTQQANLLSSGWFAANHACASIYVPVHICDDGFFDPYETGEAANLSLALLQTFGHENVTILCEGVEKVFLNENEVNEILAFEMIQNGFNITPFLTAMDQAMQEQAFLTMQLWLSTPNATRRIVENLWREDYQGSLKGMQQAIYTLSQDPGLSNLIPILTKILQSVNHAQQQRATVQR